MTDSVTEIFSKHLPSVSSDTANDFARGMRLYHTAFQNLRDTAMNYETLPEYQASSHVMKVPSDQFWPFTPYFRKAVVLVIQDLFKTKITSMATNGVTMAQTLVLIDDHANRWIMTVKEYDSDSTLNQITIYFPRSNTPTHKTHLEEVSAEQILDSAYLTSHGFVIIVNDIKHWNDKQDTSDKPE